MSWPPISVHHGDAIAALQKFPPATFHANVVDPPYGLKFGGALWDHGVPGVDYWRATMDTLKPGAHLAAFSSPRTYHRLTCAIEDAGFEIREGLIWVHGQGFPKGLDVAKAIDKRRHDRDDVLEVCRWVREQRDRAGVTNNDIDAAFGFHGMAGHWTSVGTQPAVPTLEQVPTLLATLRTTEAELPPRIRELVVELNGQKGEFGAAWHAREVTGTLEEWTDRSNYAMTQRDGLRRDNAHSEDAKKWENWSTALKPAFEPIVLARKPLPSGYTIAANVLEYGTGALNIGACGVEFSDDADRSATAAKNRHGDFDSDARGQTRAFGADNRKRGNYDADTRHPTNVLLDPDAAALLDASTGEPVSRFFYTAKASTDERDAGCGDLFWRVRSNGTLVQVTREKWETLNPKQRAEGNPHPTVKPLDLMRWVCRLITPPGGRILDQFVGSGSTLAAATLEGFAADGIDKDPAFVTIAEHRARYWRAEAERIAEGGVRPPADADPGQLDIF